MNQKTEIKTHFSQYFDIDQSILESEGTFNVSIINDLPLFVDPFLLFNSKKHKYQELHNQIIQYLRFLRDKSIAGINDPGLLLAWYTFSEIKQNWLGFSQIGNRGHGLGSDFAKSLNKNLNRVFSSFGNETITKSSHLEKLCLIKYGVGRDNISDFATNLIKEYLLEYTQNITKKYIKPKLRKKVRVEKVRFNYSTETWESAEYLLPYLDDDWVLLTPKSILQKTTHG